MVVKWACGVTTVPSRRADLLPRTLRSLAAAGFDKPRLFVDGGRAGDYEALGLEVTVRTPAIRIYGNWLLSLWELVLREPTADRYAIFQDDLIACQNLRQYLEKAAYPDHGYCNLYTFPHNEALNPTPGKPGWFLADQMGKGAVGLIFSREAAGVLLSQRHLFDRLQDAHRGHRAVDGAIVTAYKTGKTGWHEYVHHPCLIQHTGLVSSAKHQPHPQAASFPGEDFDALELLKSVLG